MESPPKLLKVPGTHTGVGGTLTVDSGGGSHRGARGGGWSQAGDTSE